MDHSPGHFWSLPVLLGAASRGQVCGFEELNSDNEEELLKRRRRRRVELSPVPPWRHESLGELLAFAEGLCEVREPVPPWVREPVEEPLVGRSHDRLGTVLTQRPVVDKSTSSSESEELEPAEPGCAARSCEQEHQDCEEHRECEPEAQQEAVESGSPSPKKSVKVCESFRSETISENSGPGASLCCLRRAACRFTHQGAWFCGMPPGYVDFECENWELGGRERSSMRQILDAVDEDLAALQRGTARERAEATDSIPALLANLSGQLRIYHFQLGEKRMVETMDGCAVLLEVMSRLVEVLDTLAPQEVDATVTATPCFRDLVCDALNEALGLQGFLPLCIAYLSSQDVSDLSLEMALHAMMAVQLCLLWCPPARVTMPEDSFIASGGYESVLSLMAEMVTELEEEPWDMQGLERLALAMDILRLGLRSNAGIDHVCGHGELSELPTVAPLALRALQALSFSAAEHHSPVAMAALPAAVRLISTLLRVTPIAKAMQLAHVVHALKLSLQSRPLTLPLTAAFKELTQPQRGRWFSQGREASMLRRDFFRALAQEQVLNDLALAATERVEQLMAQRQATGQSYVPCRGQGMKEVAVESLEDAVMISSYYDNVEAAVLAVYGKTSKVEEMAELQELRASLRPATALQHVRRHLGRCLPLPRSGWVSERH